jgi:YD repeat-containing protein
MTSVSRRGKLRPLSSALDELLGTLAPPGVVSASSATVGGVFARWDDAVGPQVAAHARPVRLAEGRLVVEVDEPGWATQLRYLEADLLERLRAVAGPGVAGLDFRVKRS